VEEVAREVGPPCQDEPVLHKLCEAEQGGCTGGDGGAQAGTVDKPLMRDIRYAQYGRYGEQGRVTREHQAHCARSPTPAQRMMPTNCLTAA